MTAHSSATRSLTLLAIFATACGADNSNGSDASTSTDASANPMSMEVGPAGGTVAGPNGVSIVIPPGALSAMQTISITPTSMMPPAMFRQGSPIYQFGPDGLTFAMPVTVTIPFTAGFQDPHLYRSNATGGYDDINGTVQGGNKMVGMSDHFSAWWIGGPPMVAALPTKVNFTWTVNGRSPGNMMDCTKQINNEREPRDLFVKVVVARNPTQNPYYEGMFTCTATTSFITAMVRGDYSVDVALTTQDLRYFGFRYNGMVNVDGSGTPIDIPLVPLTNP